MTKLDGDARGGAALSVRAVTGKPIKFAGVGEKLDALEPFHPDRMAERILGMGDVVSLIEKAQETVAAEEAAELEKRLRAADFTLDDFLVADPAGAQDGRARGHPRHDPGPRARGPREHWPARRSTRAPSTASQAIIHSMTAAERAKPTLINGQRRERIAKGSGVDGLRRQPAAQAVRPDAQDDAVPDGSKGKGKRFSGMPRHAVLAERRARSGRATGAAYRCFTRAPGMSYHEQSLCSGTVTSAASDHESAPLDTRR